MTHAQAAKTLWELMRSKVHQLTPAERAAVEHAIEQLFRMEGLEH